MATEPPVLVPTSQIPVGRGLVDEVVDGRAQVVDPALQREVALAGAAAPEVERHRRPAELVGHAIDQLGKGAGALAGVERSDREPVAQDHAGQRPMPAGGARQVAGQGEVAGLELAVHTGAYALGLRRRRVMPGRANV